MTPTAIQDIRDDLNRLRNNMMSISDRIDKLLFTLNYIEGEIGVIKSQLKEKTVPNFPNKPIPPQPYSPKMPWEIEPYYTTCSHPNISITTHNNTNFKKD